jgi:hypothetical protein
MAHLQQTILVLFHCRIEAGKPVHPNEKPVLEWLISLRRTFQPGTNGSVSIAADSPADIVMAWIASKITTGVLGEIALQRILAYVIEV